MLERIRLTRAHDAGITKCVCVLIVGNMRYERDVPNLGWPNVRHSFPRHSESSAEQLQEWADRIIDMEFTLPETIIYHFPQECDSCGHDRRELILCSKCDLQFCSECIDKHEESCSQ